MAGPDVFLQGSDSCNVIGKQYSEFGIDPTWFIWDTCPWLIETIPAMQHDPHRVEDVLKVDADPEGKNGDDPYDSARYGLMEEGSAGGDGVMVSY